MIGKELMLTLRVTERIKHLLDKEICILTKKFGYFGIHLHNKFA